MALGVVMVALRLLAVAGIRAYLYFDSAEYEIVDFTGRYRRPWATPLLYWVVNGNGDRILVQAVIGGLAWTALAVAASRWFGDRWVRAAVVGAVCALGLTTQVTNWDTAILSESLALSLTALVLAAWLELVRRPTTRGAAVVTGVTLLWLFTRQSLLPAAWMVVGVVVASSVWVWRRHGLRRPLAAVTVGLVLVAGLTTWSYSRNREVARDNVTFIVVTRVAPHPDRLEWFVDQGMPASASGEYHFAEMMEDPGYVRWVEGEGLSTYVRYLATHPWYTLTAPLDDLVGERRSFGDEVVFGETLLSPGEAYGASRPVIPEVVESVLFNPGHTGGIVFALVATAVATGWAWSRRQARWTLPLAIVGVSLVALVVGWHGAASELGRLSLIAAVTLRVGLILQLALVIETHRVGPGLGAEPGGGSPRALR